MVINLDVYRFGFRFADVSHVSSSLAGFEGSMATIWFRQWQVSLS